MRGTLPSQSIEKLIADGCVISSAAIKPEQIQPSSLDLTLSRRAFSMPGSLMPLAGERVTDLIERYSRYPIDLKEPGVLVRDNVYLILLAERFALPEGVGAYANNKSSTGRIDLQTRVLADGTPRYDKIPEGYSGELWLEVIPKSFDVKVRAGDSLNQTIFYADRSLLSGDEMRALYAQSPLLWQQGGKPVPMTDALYDGGEGEALLMTLDLDQPVAGYVSRKNFRPVDLARIGEHDANEYFEPIMRPKDGTLFLSQGAFYIFSTCEFVSVPPDYAVEMLPYDTSAGEFRAHYAGFFDPGFGYGAKGEVKGTPAVLEVRPYEDDLIVRHRQPVCKMAYEKLNERPSKLYGVGLQSNYAAQRGPRLSKFFRQ
ncbi:MAG: 2'-deoxycytidine 5'-triphosphate deaminase [Planctomycetes bacterium]|nr:2'-deoxycytidine 5'-triphosphate deaminase [Planctomycetota bacterium]